MKLIIIYIEEPRLSRFFIKYIKNRNFKFQNYIKNLLLTFFYIFSHKNSIKIYKTNKLVTKSMIKFITWLLLKLSEKLIIKLIKGPKIKLPDRLLW